MKKINVFKLIFLVLFAAVIVVPVVTMDIAGGKYSPNEQRNLAAFPVTKNDETGKFDTGRTEVQNWISDNIGYRENLIKLCVNFKYKVLGQSTSEKVLVGKDGWFFYTLDNNTKIATGEYPLTEDDLKIIAQNQQAISDYYKSVGVNYILMLTPSKVSIYSDYLPGSDKTVDKTPVDIVTEYLREHTDVIVYNAKDALLEAKNNGAGKLFHKTDTHWTQMGSYYAYKGLHQVMADNGILDDDPIDVTFTDGESKGEFSAMLGDNDLLPPETVPVANWDVKSSAVNEGDLFNLVTRMESQKGLPGFEANLFKNPTIKKGSLQIYGDSQTNLGLNIPLYLAEHFNTTVKYAIRNPSVEADEITEPTTVVFQCSERYVNSILLQRGDLPYSADLSAIPSDTVQLQNTGYYGMYLDNVNNRNLYNEDIELGTISSKLYQNNDTVNFYGWAADFNVGMPLSNLYLKIGDRTIECQYGIEHYGVAETYQNENLKMTGFNVTVPKSYLDGVDEIEFIQVGNDGTYRFETVKYKICG